MFISVALILAIPFALYFYLQSRKQYLVALSQHNEIEIEYSPITEAEASYKNLNQEYEKLQIAYKDDLVCLRIAETKLSQYNLGVGTTDSISYKSISSKDDLSLLEEKLLQVKTNIKGMVSNKTACISHMGSNFVINGKRSEAKKFFNREIKLRIRCLDNEFKAAVAVADWNNINRLIQRSENAFNDINSSGRMVKTYLEKKYLACKVKELRLVYEIEQLKSDIKEEECEERRLEREVEREAARIEKAAEKAKKERQIMEKLVASELSKLESSTEEQVALYQLHKEELEKLKEKEKRAVSLAQITRAGYVYVISNEASFGSGICKIGMTRRAEPYDRVKELGDASVPELFKVHAFAYTKDAPTLEAFLHKAFSEQRVNLVNKRKEFFFVAPDEVLDKLKIFDGSYELSELAEYA
ncbi:MAG: GIY-YIG nuclease family protein [Oceanospirillaceae bacterium]|jgi:hypothetical protein